MSTGDDGVRPTLRVCPGGPLLVRGARTITTDDGVDHTVQRPVVALCRCGLTTRAPYCDASHKAVPTS